MQYSYQRSAPLSPLKDRLERKLNLIQAIVGPRQVGKTTAIHQFLDSFPWPSIYETADLLSPPDVTWIETQWNRARNLSTKEKRVLLVLDEVQKIPRWSEAVKRFHDQDVSEGSPVRAILLGSSALMMQRGLRESLAGRFELIPFTHWSFQECRDAFGLSLDEYFFLGGYPGGIRLFLESKRNEEEWQRYIRDALIETVIGKDILLLTPVDKPALFRQVFQLAAAHPSEILAYTKMIGQLQDAGNTTTVASYLQLLQAAELIAPLQRYSGSVVKQRASSPKLVILNNALTNALMARSFQKVCASNELRGRLVENSVGAHLYNHLIPSGASLFYWRMRDDEVDFVLQQGEEIIGIEVKSGQQKMRGKGLHAFLRKYPRGRGIVVGGEGSDYSLEDFMKLDVHKLFEL